MLFTLRYTSIYSPIILAGLAFVVVMIASPASCADQQEIYSNQDDAGWWSGQDFSNKLSFCDQTASIPKEGSHLARMMYRIIQISCKISNSDNMGVNRGSDTVPLWPINLSFTSKRQCWPSGSPLVLWRQGPLDKAEFLIEAIPFTGPNEGVQHCSEDQDISGSSEPPWRVRLMFAEGQDLIMPPRIPFKKCWKYRITQGEDVRTFTLHEIKNTSAPDELKKKLNNERCESPTAALVAILKRSLADSETESWNQSEQKKSAKLTADTKNDTQQATLSHHYRWAKTLSLPKQYAHKDERVRRTAFRLAKHLSFRQPNFRQEKKLLNDLVSRNLVFEPLQLEQARFFFSYVGTT
jgi:hypothetical protein